MRISHNPLAVQSQNWIFAAFIKLLLTIPFDDITVSMICKTANLDRRTFYRYFDNKQDVLNAYIEKEAKEYLAHIIGKTFTDAKAYSRAFFNFWSGERREFLRALQRGNVLHTTFLTNTKYFMEVAEAIDASWGQSSTDYEMAYRVGGLINVLSLWIEGGFAQTPDEMAEVVSKVLV